jgi:hypothetical protein
VDASPGIALEEASLLAGVALASFEDGSALEGAASAETDEDAASLLEGADWSCAIA